jgi:UDP-2-acetamido-3-amino-2,3-dideoxy-glucuronate N-acetyltransferase
MAGVRVHPTAEVSPDAVIGDGTSIWHWAQIREGARIGRRCNIGKDVYIDAAVVVGDDCKIQNFATLYRGVTLGNRVFVGPHACFTNDLYPRAVSPDWKIVPTSVENGASIGANATILCGITIGRNAMVAAGAVVTNDVEPHSLVAGVPARIIGWVCDCGRPLDRGMRCAHDGKTYPELNPKTRKESSRGHG